MQFSFEGQGLWLFMLLILFILVAFFMFFRADSNKKEIQRRAMKLLATYSSSDDIKTAISTLRKGEEKSYLSEILNGLPSLGTVKRKIERLDGDYTLAMFAKRMVIYFIATFFITKFVFGMGLLLAITISACMAYMLPNFGLNRRINKRNQQFLKLLPDALDLIVRGLRSGLPVTESMHSIVDEIGEPVKSVFSNISSAIKVGMSFEQALYDCAKKLQLNEFNFFAISISLQKETGGNLAEILQNLSETIRARAMMKLKIKAISSEARASSYIVGSLPFVVAAVLLMTSPKYLNPLFEEFSGNIALATAIGMFSFGMFLMHKMAQMEV